MEIADTSKRVRQMGMELFFQTPIYRLLLRGSHPVQLAVKPDNPWPGDPAVADLMFQGHYRFGGFEMVAPNQPPWRLPGATPGWLAGLHGFEWLCHFEAAGGETAQRHGRNLVGSWLSHCGNWDPVTWRADTLGRRLIAWILHTRFLFDDAEPTFRSAALQSMARQARHLSRAVTHAPPGAGAITARVGLLFAALCLPNAETRRDRSVELVIQAIDDQILPDGGHISRNPSEHHRVLRDIITARHVLRAANAEVPQSLQNAIDRMCPMLRFFRHGDHRLALFNGAKEGEASELDRTLAVSEAKGKAPSDAPHTGFSRIAHGGTLLMIEPGSEYVPKRTGHASLAAIELSERDHRIIVNCGAPDKEESGWSLALAATAAHSTVTVGDRNSTEILPGQRLGRGPKSLKRNRVEADGQVWLDISHDGYGPAFGLTHRRRIYVNETGENIRGEDNLIAARQRRSDGRPIAVRFHLHPDVKASLLQDDGGVLLRTGAGAGWRFRSSGGAIQLDNSVYFGKPGDMRRSQQIVVTSRCQGAETTIKWAFARVGDGAPGERGNDAAGKETADDGST